MYKTLYFCFAGGILLLSVIVVNIAPAINGLVRGSSWSYQSCKSFSDNYKYTEKKEITNYYTKEEKEADLDDIKKAKTMCERKKAMVGLEYTALNINLVCGFICTLLGFFHFFNIGDVGKVASFAGLGTGIVGFVLTLVYVIESGLVFNDISIDDDSSFRIDPDGAFLKWDNSRNRYVCIYFDKNDRYSLYLKYSNYGNKFLNYNKDISFMVQDKNYKYYNHLISEDLGIEYHSGGCNYYSIANGIHFNPSSMFDTCKDLEDKKIPFEKLGYYDGDNKKIGDCNKLFYIKTFTDNKKKRLYDHWLTTIILSCFIFILDILLALFGFLLMSNSGKGGF
jgi:hypothetical protein